MPLLPLSEGLSLFLLALAALLAARLVWVLPCSGCRARSRGRRQAAASLLYVLGSGGHTAEMLSLLSALPRAQFWPRTAVAADTDVTSEARARAAGALGARARLLRIPRAREVGQPAATAILSTCRACLVALRLVAAVRPDVLLVNGPGTCVPVALAALGLNLLGLTDCRIVFVESICRVQSLSATGRLMYWLADAVHVQWPELHRR